MLLISLLIDLTLQAVLLPFTNSSDFGKKTWLRWSIPIVRQSMVRKRFLRYPKIYRNTVNHLKEEYWLIHLDG